jgi:hypothetical protein
VHGISNHEIAIAVALGMQPHIPKVKGAFKCAAKFHLRRYADCKVLKVPSEENIARIAQEIPGTEIHISVEPGMQLSDLRDQDAFSFEIATVHLGAMDQPELLRRFRYVAETLEFEFDDGGKPEPVQFNEPTQWQ